MALFAWRRDNRLETLLDIYRGRMRFYDNITNNKMSLCSQKQPVAIVASKNVNGTTCYKVRWAHNDQTTETWEPVSALFDYMYLVADYEINGHQNGSRKPSAKLQRRKTEKLKAIEEARESEEQSANEQEWRPDENLHRVWEKKWLVGLKMESVGWYRAEMREEGGGKVEGVMRSEELVRAYPEQFMRFLEGLAF